MINSPKAVREVRERCVPIAASAPDEKWSMTLPRVTPYPPAGPRRILSLYPMQPDSHAAPDAARPRSRAHLRFSRRAQNAHVREPWNAVRFILSLILALLALSFWAIERMSPRLAERELSFPAPVGQGWSRQQTPPYKGSNSQRRLIVYQQSTPIYNWRMDFQWRAEARGIGLVFRSRDARNYDGARLRPIADGFVEEHFRVAGGIESQHFRKTITVANLDRNIPVAVALEIRGSNVSLYLRDELADSWNDRKADPGGIGFFQERTDKVQARTIRLSYRDRSMLRTVQSSLQTAPRGVRGWWDSLWIDNP